MFILHHIIDGAEFDNRDDTTEDTTDGTIHDGFQIYPNTNTHHHLISIVPYTYYA